MNMKKWGVALSLAATFGLMACGDSSSSDDFSCRVSSDANSVTMDMSYMGQSMSTEATLQGDKLVVSTTLKGFSSAEVDEACEEMKRQFRGGTCDGNTHTYTTDAEDATIEEMRVDAESSCKEMEADFEEYGDY